MKELYDQLRYAVENEDLPLMERLTDELQEERRKRLIGDNSVRFALQSTSIYDKKSGLSWKTDASAVGGSIAYGNCAGAIKRKYGEGWRLPTRPEFETLMSGLSDDPSYDLQRIGFDINRFWYWTSTPSGTEGNHYSINMGDYRWNSRGNQNGVCPWAVKDGME